MMNKGKISVMVFFLFMIVVSSTESAEEIDLGFSKENPNNNRSMQQALLLPAEQREGVLNSKVKIQICPGDTLEKGNAARMFTMGGVIDISWFYWLLGQYDTTGCKQSSAPSLKKTENGE